MKTNSLLILAACAGLVVSCATPAPKELLDAREAYRRASSGMTAQVAPAELHVASLALAQAEQSFRDNSDSYQTRDLAYVAQRKAEIAAATASISIEKKTQARATNDYQATQSKIVAKNKQDLSQTRTALAESERTGKATADQLTAEKTARTAAEGRASVAQAALAALAAVKDEPRGLVITLSGSVLFASNQSDLLPEARTRLGQVADVLLTTRERSIVIEGHTDAQGTDAYNFDLSQRRADTVRDFLVHRGYEADLIQAHGLGKGHPIASNSNAEGRANNRRVEIGIEHEAAPSNP
jgi:outer membrane protein OmpA-like peptidoglycan-associated protein